MCLNLKYVFGKLPCLYLRDDQRIIEYDIAHSGVYHSHLDPPGLSKFYIPNPTNCITHKSVLFRLGISFNSQISRKISELTNRVEIAKWLVFPTLM